MTTHTQESRNRLVRLAPAIAATAFLAAVLARLPALSSWWCLDDWGELARAAGRLPPPPGLPARWLSQQAWWSLTWPLFGLQTVAHSWLRILLHAVAAGTVARLARRAGLAPLPQLVAGLLFAATPVAFTALFWASGIQELLAGTLALLAVDRWLAGERDPGGQGSLMAAGILGIGSILAKESALGLPLFFLGTLIAHRSAHRGEYDRAQTHMRLRWTVALLLLLAAGLETLLVVHHFAHAPEDPYAVGGLLVMLGNLGKFGWWLPTPGPVFTARVTWTHAAIGIAVWGIWGIYGVLAWRRGRRSPLTAWACALLSVAPALPLVNQARPYMGYLAAAAGSLTLASLLPARVRMRGWLPVALAIVAVFWGQWSMRARIARTGSDDLPADPVVRAVQVARTSAEAILRLVPQDLPDPFRLVIFQAHLTAPGAVAGPATDQDALRTRPYNALGGATGVHMLLGRSADVQWTSSLLASPPDALVICETTSGFQAWGPLHDALLYAAELHLVAGNFDQTLAQLARAYALAPDRELRAPDPGVLAMPQAPLRARAAEFQEWLQRAAANGQIPPADLGRYRDFPVPP
jgi:hypothetical protein